MTQAAVPADLQILATGKRLPPLPTVGLTVQCDLKRPPALVTEFAQHLEATLPTL